MQPAKLIQLLLFFLVVPATDAQPGKGPQREEPANPPVIRRLLREVLREGQCSDPQPNCTDLTGGECVSLSQVCSLCGPPGHLLDDFSCDGGPRFFCCVTNNECIDAGGSCQFRLPWLQGGSDGRESDDSQEFTTDGSKRFTTALRCSNNTQLQCYIDSLKADCAEEAGFCTYSEECRDGDLQVPDLCGSGQLCCKPNTVRACEDAKGMCIPLDQECSGTVSTNSSHVCTASTKCCIPQSVTVCTKYGGVCMDEEGCDYGYLETREYGACDICCLSETNDSRCSVFPNVNFTGDILAIIPSVKSPAWCRNLCYFSPTCKFYTWIGPSFSEPSRHFNCLLQTSLLRYPKVITSPVEGMISGLHHCDRDCAIYGAKYIGEILNATSAEQQTCETMCENNFHCTFWSWNSVSEFIPLSECTIQKSGMTGNGDKLPQKVEEDSESVSGFRNCDDQNSPWLGPNPDTCTC